MVQHVVGRRAEEQALREFLEAVGVKLMEIAFDATRPPAVQLDAINVRLMVDSYLG